MSFLHEPLVDDRQLERYLLGLLPEEEEERLDQASIEDDSVALQLRTAEDDLIEGYVRRTLERETLQRFETYYLSSPRRRERVAVAARFLGAVDRAAVGSDSRRQSLRDSQPGASLEARPNVDVAQQEVETLNPLVAAMIQ